MFCSFLTLLVDLCVCVFFLKNDLFLARNALHEAPELLESLSRFAERHQKTIGQVSLGHFENIHTTEMPKKEAHGF